MNIKGDHIKVLGFMPLHYGADYFTEACRSVLPAVDELFVCYTPRPSYGHAGEIKRPKRDKEVNLYKQFIELRKYPEAAGKRLKWEVTTKSKGESQHRNIGSIYAQKQSFDIMVSFDSDEIWDTDSLFDCVHQAYNSSQKYFYTEHSGWKHFYRSFGEYCQDSFQPVRLVNFNNYVTSYGVVTGCKIYHMGYAIKEDVMDYKLSCHGHKGEIDISEFTQIWNNYNKNEWDVYIESGDFIPDKSATLHPVSKQVWRKTKLQDKNELPDLLKNHKFFNLNKI